MFNMLKLRGSGNERSGSDFLGSHVADALTNAGYETTIFDIQKSPYLQKEQEMIVGDVLDREYSPIKELNGIFIPDGGKK